MSGRWGDRIASVAGFLGITAILAGLGFLLIELRITGTSGFLFVWGVALVLVWVILTPEPFMDFIRGRGIRFGTLSLVTSAFLLGILVVANVFASQHPDAKADLTRLQVHTLSDQTRQLLGKVNSPLVITAFIDSTASAGTTGQQPVVDLLAEYHAVNSKVDYRVYDPRQYRQLAALYQVQSLPSIYFDYNKHRESVTATTEGDLDSGILKVVQGQAKKICFITGHSEPGVGAGAGGQANPGDYAQLAGYLQQQNFVVSAVALTDTVPADCNALVELAPQHPLADVEITNATAYLKSGGHLLVMAEAYRTQNLNALLSGFGTTLDGGVLFDTARRMGGDPTRVPVQANPGHKITEQLTGFVFAGITATGVTADPQKPAGYTLSKLAGVDGSIYEAPAERTDYTSTQADDKKGPFTVAEAIESSAKAANGQHTRIVVIGSAQFVTDQVIAQLSGNAALLVETLNWVTEREVSVAIPAKGAQTDRLKTVDPGDQRRLFIILSLMLPAVILLSGLSVYLNRR